MHDFSDDQEALDAKSAAFGEKQEEKPEDATAPVAADPEAVEDSCREPQLRQDGEVDIPWRGMPSLPAMEPPAVGVLLGAYDADTGIGVGGGLEGELPAQCPKAGRLTAEVDAAFNAAFSEESAPGGDYTGESELVLGVKLSQYGPVYFFKAGQEKLRPGAQILVETDQGLALGEVITARRLRLPLPKIRTDDGAEVEIKPIRGLAGPEDIAAAADNRILASSARLFCKECIRERKLEMKLVDVEVLHDRSKIIFYFTAPSRIDFRELVKDLVRNYHTRIELRQIGVRHETQMLGAVGNCGMTCCCRRYLRKFAPVTIKMAKEQNLFLNPAKLSGICGRLLCCLAYEQENYEEFHKRSPKIGKRYNTDKGFMRVLRANLFRQSIIVLDENNEEAEMQLDEWEALHPARQDQSPDGNAPGAHQPREGRERRSGEDGGSEGSGRGERNQKERRPDSRSEHRSDQRHGQRSDRRHERGQPEEERAAREKAKVRHHKNESQTAPLLPDDGNAINPGEQTHEAALGPSPRTDAAVHQEDGPNLDVRRPEADDSRSIFGLPGSRYAHKEHRNNERAPYGKRPDGSSGSGKNRRS